VPDLDRYQIYTLAQDTLTITVNFPVYGEQEDIAVTVNGVELGLESWQLVSASGTPTSQLPRPITDGQVMFSPVIPSGSVVEIIGSFQPRQTSMPTAPGLARREFNQVTGGLWSTLREIKRQIGKTAAPVAMHADASGTLGNRSNYDGAAAGFVYLQTDDTAMRPIFYVKNSASAGDWSQALIVQSQSVSGFPVLARADGHDLEPRHLRERCVLHSPERQDPNAGFLDWKPLDCCRRRNSDDVGHAFAAGQCRCGPESRSRVEYRCPHDDAPGL
jgi:hypothetical protein